MRPIFEFANLVWAPCFDISLIENVQRRFTRLAFRGQQRPSYEDHLHIMKLSGLSTGIVCGELITTFKDRNSPTTNIFNRHNHERFHGRHSTIRKGKFRTNTLQNFLANPVLYSWNCSTDLKNCMIDSIQQDTDIVGILITG